MKTRLIPLIAAAALTLSFAGPTAALPGDDAAGPPCANITGGAAVFSGTGPYTVTFTLETEARCGGVSYTIYVWDSFAAQSAGDPALLVLTERGTTAVSTVAYTFQNADNLVCVYAESSIGGKVLDRAFDNGECNEYLAGGTPAGQFN